MIGKGCCWNAEDSICHVCLQIQDNLGDHFAQQEQELERLARNYELRAQEREQERYEQRAQERDQDRVAQRQEHIAQQTQEFLERSFQDRWYSRW